MSNTDSPSRITYTGEPVKVNPEQIAEKMTIPDFGCSDTQPGKDAYPVGGRGAGITDGWFSVELLGEHNGECAPNDHMVARKVLEVMAAKIGAALNGE